MLKGARKTMVFAMTGGPCGGKSTAMVKISERLGALGFQVRARVLEHGCLDMTGGPALRRCSSCLKSGAPLAPLCPSRRALCG